MSKHRTVQWFWAGLLTLALVFPLLAQGNGTKIKVIVENASIRLKPSLESEAIEENIAVGTIYNSDKKVGEWYEIKTPSRLGVALLGYIHEMYVEVLAEAIAPQPEVRQPERRPFRTWRGPGPISWRSLSAEGWGSGLFSTRPPITWTIGPLASSTAMRKGRSSIR